MTELTFISELALTLTPYANAPMLALLFFAGSLFGTATYQYAKAVGPTTHHRK